MKKIVTLTALGAILAATNANAAGFHLREQSAAALGNAFAGATAGAENNSYAYFNVAGLTRQKGTQVNVGGTYIIPRAEAHDIYPLDANGNKGQRNQDVNNIVHAAISPNGTISHQLNDEVTLGLALNVPFGMITKYDGAWAGSDHGITSKVITATTTPMVAWKATDKLSVGAGLPIQYVKARLSNTVMGRQYGANLEGDTVDVGYQLGAMYEFDENTRIGVGYRSEINHKLKGDISSDAPAMGPLAKLNQDISARLDTPAMFSVGAYHRINDKWEVMAEYQRVFWNSFDSLDIYGRDIPGLISSTPENWRDTNFYAIGVSYQLDHQWKLRLGFAYDESAVKTADRTPRIPDSDRYWYSMGLNYAYSENMTFDFGFTYIQAKEASINIPATVTQAGVSQAGVSAEYDNSVKMVGLSLNYKF